MLRDVLLLEFGIIRVNGGNFECRVENEPNEVLAAGKSWMVAAKSRLLAFNRLVDYY